MWVAILVRNNLRCQLSYQDSEETATDRRKSNADHNTSFGVPASLVQTTTHNVIDGNTSQTQDLILMSQAPFCPISNPSYLSQGLIPRVDPHSASGQRAGFFVKSPFQGNSQET